MKTFKELQEGVYDPNIFKAFFLAGGPGSGKSYVVTRTSKMFGMRVVNSDDVFERYLSNRPWSARDTRPIKKYPGRSIRGSLRKKRKQKKKTKRKKTKRKKSKRKKTRRKKY